MYRRMAFVHLSAAAEKLAEERKYIIAHNKYLHKDISLFQGSEILSGYFDYSRNPALYQCKDYGRKNGKNSKSRSSFSNPHQLCVCVFLS